VSQFRAGAACGLILAGLLCLAGERAAAKEAERRCPFHPRDAEVSDKGQRRFVWRERCGNNLPDHELGGGFEWEGDSRNYIALGEANVRGQRRGGLIMLAFPDGNVLNAAWTVSFAKGQTLRIQYALTDDAVTHSTNGMKLAVLATDEHGKQHTLIERVLKRGDERIYDERAR